MVSGEKAWTLIIRREATEDYLEENGYLEMVGQTLWETHLEISHCPFCGQGLGEDGGTCEGQFVHVDHSGWTSERQ